MTRNNCPFIANLWVRHQGRVNEDPSKVFQEDWSWLEKNELGSYEQLLESEWDEFWFQKMLEKCPSMQRDLTQQETVRNWLRNRMVMGAFRYGPLIKKSYLLYDLKASIFIRESLARETQTIEPLLDALNISYLQSLKSDHEIWIKVGQDLLTRIDFAMTLNWPLGATDDGIHSEKEVKNGN